MNLKTSNRWLDRDIRDLQKVFFPRWLWLQYVFSSRQFCLYTFMIDLVDDLAKRSIITLIRYKNQIFASNSSIPTNSPIGKGPEKKHTIRFLREAWIPDLFYRFFFPSPSPFSMGREDTFWWRSMPRWKRCLIPWSKVTLLVQNLYYTISYFNIS